MNTFIFFIIIFLKELKLALLASQSIHKHKQGKFTVKL